MSDKPAVNLPEVNMDSAAEAVVALGNQLAEADPEADLWDIADGILAGAVHYWLYACQPCGDPRCEDCASVASADQRVAELKRLVEGFAADSTYYHAPTDIDVAHA